MKFIKSQTKKLGSILALLSVALIATSTLQIATSTSASAFSFSHTYMNPGESSFYTVPAGVTEARFTLQGGNGSSGSGQCAGSGGYGAFMSGTITFPGGGGGMVGFYVGANGDFGGGHNHTSGGFGGTVGGGQGGSSSYIQVINTGFYDAAVLGAGGGGGGAGDGIAGDCTGVTGGNGGDAGAPLLAGSDGFPGGQNGSSFPGGSGATATNEGLGTSMGLQANMDGHPGVDFDGGNGGIERDTGFSPVGAGGGGGGSGWLGAGGGAGGDYSGAGGGGGASYYDSGVITLDTYETGDASGPFITFEFETTPTTTATTTTAPSGGPTTTAPPIPNGGDLNGDGTKDDAQSNVKPFLNNAAINVDWAAIEVSSGCVGESLGTKKESQLDVQDKTYDYPAGLMDFELGCLTPGQTVTVSQYYYGLTQMASDFVARKFTTYNNQYQNLDGASAVDMTIGGKHVVKLTYSLTDGGQYDNDQLANGTIVDPAGLGIVPGTLPTTGTNVSLYLSSVLTLLGVGSVLFIAAKKRRYNFKN